MTGLESSQNDFNFMVGFNSLGSRFTYAENLFKYIQTAQDRPNAELRAKEAFEVIERLYFDIQYDMMHGVAKMENLHEFCARMAYLKKEYMNPVFQKSRDVLDTEIRKTDNLSDVSL